MIKELQKDSVESRQSQQKELLIGQLKKAPIVQIACEKIGVGRATYYRWRKQSKEFRKASDQALIEGKQLINDMAESQLLSAIRDKNMTSIIFWLKNNKANYSNRIEITTKQSHEQEKLNPKQEQVIKEALRLAALISNEPSISHNEKPKNEDSNNDDKNSKS